MLLKNIRLLLLFTLSATLFFISGCGNSSSSADSTTIDGVVIDGYWRDAKVCVDVTPNNQCDSDEPYVMSGVNGKYSITVPNAYINTKNLVAEGIAGETYDEGLKKTIDKNTIFTTPATKQYIITPITTLVKAKIDEGKATEEAESEVATLLNIPRDKLFSDYVESNDTDIEVMAEKVTEALQSDNNNYAQAITSLEEEKEKAPKVSATSPETNATGVALNSFIMATFSKDINSSTVTTDTFILADNSGNKIGGSVATTSSTATFTPSNDLSAYTTYTATLSAFIKDSGGVTLFAPHSWSFTTGSSTKNLDPVASNFIYGTPVINSAKTFNWLTESNATDPEGETLSATVSKQGGKGEASVNGNNVTYTPSSNKSGEDTFDLNITDLSNQSATITVTVTGIDTIAPTVTSTSPVANATDVAIDSTVTATFSRDINASSVTSSLISLKDTTNSNVNGNISVTDNAISFTPKSNLDHDNTHTMTIKAGIKDMVGNVLASDYSWSFKTGANSDPTPPEFVSSMPADGDIGMAPDINITITFSEAIKPSTVTDTSVILKNSGDNTVSTTKAFSDTKTLAITPDSNLSQEMTYTLTLTTAITDEAGNALKEAKDISFTTRGSFYLADNGMTIRCEDASVGDTGIVGGVEYTKRSKDQITENNAAATCTSGITDMSQVFYMKTGFDANISHWDTSSVENMSQMFMTAQNFNQPINHWDTSSVKNMYKMFRGSLAFNQPLGSWDTSSVENMESMFEYARDFDQDIGAWNTGKVTNMKNMFKWAFAFDQNIGGWDTSTVTDMSAMFSSDDPNNPTAFNQDIGGWDTSKVENMSYMFEYATSFNQNLSGWNVNEVTDCLNFATGASAWNDANKPSTGCFAP